MLLFVCGADTARPAWRATRVTPVAFAATLPADTAASAAGPD